MCFSFPDKLFQRAGLTIEKAHDVAGAKRIVLMEGTSRTRLSEEHKKHRVLQWEMWFYEGPRL